MERAATAGFSRDDKRGLVLRPLREVAFRPSGGTLAAEGQTMTNGADRWCPNCRQMVRPKIDVSTGVKTLAVLLYGLAVAYAWSSDRGHDWCHESHSLLSDL